MRTPPKLRKRFASQPVAGLAPGLAQISAGIFGYGSPLSNLSNEVSEDPGEISGFYELHQGDIFTPGTGNWVLDPSLEIPLQTSWGHGFIFANSPTPVFQPPQLMMNVNPFVNGYRGIMTGQVLMQPLLAINPAEPSNLPPAIGAE